MYVKQKFLENRVFRSHDHPNRIIINSFPVPLGCGTTFAEFRLSPLFSMISLSHAMCGTGVGQSGTICFPGHLRNRWPQKFNVKPEIGPMRTSVKPRFARICFIGA